MTSNKTILRHAELLKPSLDVALESVVLGTLDSGTLEEVPVLLFGEGLPVVGCHLQQGF